MAVSKKKTSDMNASSEKNPSEKALSREVIFETLTDMLSELLDMKKSDFSEDTMIFEELPLDSLQLYELVVDLEERFDLQISDEAIEKIRSVGDVVDMIHDAAK
ncbi:MAG: acyl carrier protein [Clostridiales bacterium]|nr:acyl carrier protein [Clostridiales bacterium]MBQ5967908.1 acyl carrier protein [Clostridiales bacterium]MBQ6270525.1 acyl carrier protein [Clostridiales bacterium]MBR4010904.1 acyl carrier protein [Clostridiales bacterium]